MQTFTCQPYLLHPAVIYRQHMELRRSHLTFWFLTLVLPCPKHQRIRLRQNKVDGHWEYLTHTATHPVTYRTGPPHVLHRHSES